jgi:hypothetical protein
MTTLSSIRLTRIEDAGAGGVQVYATPDLLPTTGLTAGDQAFVTSNQRLYISTGSGWYNVALINSTPTFTTGPDATYALSNDLTPTVITLLAQDSDGQVVTYSASDSGMTGIATLSQDSSVFTITPLTDSAGGDIGTFTITFQATDGIGIASELSTFTLSFGPDWANPTNTQILPTTSIAAAAFGSAAAISDDGNYAVISARSETSGRGAVYVYTVSGSTFTQQAQLIPSVNSQTYSFGENVVINSDGTYIAVCCKREPVGGNSNQGAVYIFTRSGSTWTEQQRILNPLASTAAQYFGADAAIDDTGTYLLITEYNHHDPGSFTNTGTVHFYTRSGSTWTKQGEVQSTDLATEDYYGSSVSMTPDGTYAIISAPQDDSPSQNAGSCYIFTRSGTTWTQQAKINASDAAFNDYFGGCVTISGDSNYAIVASSNTDGASTGDGAVYVFTRSGSTWTQQAKLIAPDTVNTDSFGGSNFGERRMDINSDGTIVAVGAPGKDVSGYLGVGRIYIFERDGSTWSQTEIVDHPGISKDYYQLGTAVAMNSDGSSILAGAVSDNPSSVNNAGAAYFFEA